MLDLSGAAVSRKIKEQRYLEITFSIPNTSACPKQNDRITLTYNNEPLDLTVKCAEPIEGRFLITACTFPDEESFLFQDLERLRVSPWKRFLRWLQFG